MANWDNAVVVDSRELQRLRDEHAKLQKASRKQRLLLLILAGGCAVTGLGVYLGALRLTAAERDAQQCRKHAMHSSMALAALARSQQNILTATEKAPSVGTKSWGRRFTVTKYLPRDPAYGKFNTGYTSTLWFRADSDTNNHELRRLTDLRDRRKKRSGLDALIQKAPHFAEAYNQRAILHFQALTANRR